MLVRPGAKVDAGTVLVELSNPDVQLEALTAEQQLNGAEGALVTLKTNLETARLNQEGVVATTRTDFNEAKRNADVADGLDTLLSKNDVGKAHDKGIELETRMRIEQQRLTVMSDNIKQQISLQQDQVAKLRDIVRYQEARVQSMKVLAGADGVVQDMELQPGQWLPGRDDAREGRAARKAQGRAAHSRDAGEGHPDRSAHADRYAKRDHRRSRISNRPSAQNGTVGVEVSLDGTLPGARPDLSVDGTIEIERLKDVLYVGRPSYGQAESTVGMFQLTPDGTEATRVNVKLGRSSVNTIEIKQGLNVHDRVIISDMSAMDSHEKVRVQ